MLLLLLREKSEPGRCALPPPPSSATGPLPDPRLSVSIIPSKHEAKLGKEVGGSGGVVKHRQTVLILKTVLLDSQARPVTVKSSSMRSTCHVPGTVWGASPRLSPILPTTLRGCHNHLHDTYEESGGLRG